MFPSLAPRVRVRSSAYRLHDISLGGLAALSKQSHDDLPEVGETVALSIQQCGLPIFDSSARVCRAENTVFGSKLAFSFIDRYVEFDKLLTRNTQAQIAVRSPAFAAESTQLVPIGTAPLRRRPAAARLSPLDSNAQAAHEFNHGLDRSRPRDPRAPA